MKQLEAILFDLEGTLLDSAADIRQAVNLMLADKDRPPLTFKQVKSFYSEGMMELCRRALEATGGVPDEDLYPYVQKLIAHYRNLKPSPDQIFPHAVELLLNLKNKGIKAAICTNKGEKSTLALLKELGLNDYFVYIAGGDTFMVHKPNPGHITGLLDAIDASINNSVFIGDGPNDTVAAAKAGIPCIVIAHGRTIPADELDGNIVINEFDEVESALKRLEFDY